MPFAASYGPQAQFGRGRVRRRPGRERAASQHRLRFVKTDPVRFISHLDVVRLFDRALRRAGIAVAYSTGYSRHPKLSFGPPLPVGMIGWDEFFDVELAEERPAEFVDLLNAQLPEGIRILDAVPIVNKVQSLMSLIDHADYRVSFSPHVRRLLGDPDPHSFRTSLDEAIRHFHSHDRAYVVHQGPEGERSVEITGGVRRLATVAGDDGFPALELTLRIAGAEAVRPLDLAGFLLGSGGSGGRLDPRLLRVERLRLYGLRGDRVVAPLEAAAGEELLGVVGGVPVEPASGPWRPDVQRDRHQRRSGRDPYRHSRRW
jgi:radical SAM-linked protein